MRLQQIFGVVGAVAVLGLWYGNAGRKQINVNRHTVRQVTNNISGSIRKTSGWNGILGYVKKTGDDTWFTYRNTRISNQTGKPLILTDRIRRRFSWPPEKYVTLDTEDLATTHVFVTAANKHYYKPMLDTISSIQTFAMGYKIVVYDLGIRNPTHIQHEVLRDYPRIFYMDSSIRLLQTGDLSHIVPQLKQTNGFVDMLHGPHSLYATTEKILFTYFPTQEKLIKEQGTGIASGAGVYHRTEQMFKTIFLYWVLCALDKGCAEPSRRLYCNGRLLHENKYANCHRYDQSILAILVGNQYDFNITLYVDYMAHGDKGDFVEVKRGSYKAKPLKHCQPN